MSSRIFATILLAAGLAASKPIDNPSTLQALASRQDAPAKVNASPNPGFDVVSSLAGLQAKAQQEVVQINIDNFVLVKINVDDVKDIGVQIDETAEYGDKHNADKQSKGNIEVTRKDELSAAAQHLMLQQVNHALAIDQRVNAANNERDNVLRAMAFIQKEPDESTFAIIVQEIIISIETEVEVDNEKRERRKIDARMYKQEAIVANRGKQKTQTVMVYDPRTLTATDTAVAIPEATATDIANITKPAKNLATNTVEAVLYNAKPTHISTVEDPVVSMRAALETALEDRRKEDDRAKDVELNMEIALKIKIEIEKNNGRHGDDNDRKDENDRDVKKDQERERKQKQDEAQRMEEEKKQQQQQKQEQQHQQEKQHQQEQQHQQQQEQQREQERQKANQKEHKQVEAEKDMDRKDKDKPQAEAEKFEGERKADDRDGQ